VIELTWRMVILTAMLVAGASCSKEGRTLASDQPQTPPTGAADPRIPAYADNVYQVSQGSRYFIWYGCGACHTTDARAGMNLDNQSGQGRSLAKVYGFIADGHTTKYGDKVPVEQLWQISAYVLDRAKTDPAKTRRAGMDGRGEPQGDTWGGAVQ
jgi:cytochrome c oxidase cbb3-type subunit 3